MSSITDEVIGKAPGGVKKTAELTFRASKKISEKASDAVKGICLVLVTGTEFTTDAVMKAVKKSAFKRTGDIKFSEKNIDINKLRESGRVYQVEENILQETMKYFDQQCRQHGIKYSAMKDTRGEDEPDYKPSYMVFFEGKDTDLIMHVLREAYKDYAEEQKKAKEAQNNAKENGRTNEKQHEGKKHNKGRRRQSERPQKRESVKAKLAFFRNRVAAREQERDVTERHQQRSDIQR